MPWCWVGGTYDATNVVQPTVAIVTDVGLDHTDLLGRTKPLIARDKQGIIKPGCIGLTGSRFVKRGTYIPLDRAVIHHTSLTGTDFSYKGLKHLQLSSGAAPRNAILAIETAQRLASPARPDLVAPGSNRGASKSFPTPVIVDGAHNPQKMIAFTQSSNGFASRVSSGWSLV